MLTLNPVLRTVPHLTTVRTGRKINRDPSLSGSRAQREGMCSEQTGASRRGTAREAGGLAGTQPSQRAHEQVGDRVRHKEQEL